MGESLKYNIRTGKSIDMISVLEEMYLKYLADMKASVESFGTYSEVSYETWSDYLSVLSAINVYNKCGYLSDEETSGIASKASDIRLNLLREWEASHG